MMTIKGLELNNAFQHRKFKINEFGNFHVILGPVGSGKSNLLHSICLGLGMKFELPGTKDTAVTDGEESGDIKLTVEHEGETVVLGHKLGSSNRSLTRGKLKLRAGAEVVDYIQKNLLGAPYDVVARSSIIHQGRLIEGLFEAPAERQKAFLRLAGMADIDMKRAVLTAEIEKYSMPSMRLRVSEVVDRIVNLEKEIAKLTAESAALALKYDEGLLNECALTVSRSEEISKKKKELQQLEFEINKAEATRGTLSLELSELNKKLSDAQSRRPSQDEVDKAKISISTYDAQLRSWSSYVSVKNRLDTAKTGLTQLKDPGEYDSSQLKELLQIIADASAELTQLRDATDRLSKANCSCPTCKTPLTPEKKASLLSEFNSKIAELVLTRQEAQGLEKTTLAEQSAHNRLKRAYEDSKASFSGIIVSLDKTIAGYAGIQQPMEPVSAKAVVDAASAADKDIAYLDAQITRTNTAMNTDDKTIHGMMARREELRKIAGESDDVDLVREARKEVVKQEEYKAAINKISGQLFELNRNLAAARSDKEAAEKAEQEHALFLKYTGFLTSAKAALARDAYPAGKVKAFIDALMGRLNEYLGMMRVSFTASYDHDLGFMGYFPEHNKTQPASRLSEGEKTIFALAFRFAVNELTCPTGFLILDEPTVWLGDKIYPVIDALGHVKRKLVNRSQVIIVTHDERLVQVADKITDLGKKGE